MFCVLGLYGRFRRQGNLEYEVRVFLKGGRPPPPLQTHPHTHTMREKRRYNGALRILAVFRGRASQPASQPGGGGGGGGVPKPPSHPAAARRSSYVDNLCMSVEILRVIVELLRLIFTILY